MPGHPPHRTSSSLARASSTRGLAIAVVVTALAIALVALVVRSRPQPRGRSSASAVVAAAGAYRPVEGRLSADVRYRPHRNPERHEPRTDDVRLVTLAGELQRAAARAPTPDNLHAWGIAQIAFGRYEAGVETLQSALLHSPDNPRLLADLGAGLLAVATTLERPDELPRAAEMLEHSTRLEPNLAPAWFTKALVLERLFLPTQARAALEIYLGLDRATGWAVEARQRLADLQSAPATAWRQIEKALTDGSPTDAMLDEAAVRYQLDLRESVVRILLPAWARAKDALTREQAMTRIRQVAARLERTSGDPYFRQVAEEIDAAPPSDREVLASAILQLADAMRAQAADQATGEVLPRLDAAAATLRQRGSHLLLWVQLNAARAANILQQHDKVTEQAMQVAREAQRLGFPALEARAHWLLGITAFTTSRWTDAADHYDRALRLCDRTGEADFAASVHVNAAVLNRFLGNRRQAWAHRAKAGAGFPPHRALQIHSYLLSGAATASSEALPLAALLFQNEVVANARANLPGGPQTEAYVGRARMLARANRHADAARDLDEAAQRLAQVASEGMRGRLQRAWLLASAEVHVHADPARAADEAARAVAQITGANEPVRLAEAALLLSRALAAVGDLAGARAAAGRGIAAFESSLRSVDPRDPVRVAALEPVWALYSEAARLELVPGQENYAAAFAVFERGRARTQLDLQHIAPLTLDDARRRLAPDEGIVMLDQSADELVAWWISRDVVNVQRIPLTAVELERLVAEHRRSVDRGHRRGASSSRLFDLALRHCSAGLRKTAAVAVIADGAWNSVAWPAVWESSSGTELVSLVSTVLAPSAAVALRDRPGWRAGARSALLISAAVTDGGAVLPGARAEVQEIAGMYATRRVLEGSGASPARVLDSIQSADIVHVASHAVDVPSYPQLSHLVLGGVGRTERLFVRDVMAKDLSHVDLVVLAACSTAGRTAIRGEGSVGVAWGFLIAGVPRVIATLQDIEDGPARQLFPALHRHIVNGGTPAKSLHTVQRALAAAGESPRVWATVAIYGAL